MRHQKQNIPHIKRANTLATLKIKPPMQTIAELNKVSAKINTPVLNVSKPFRIILPDYFNVPKFKDSNFNKVLTQPQLSERIHNATEIRRKMKDIEMLTEGMRRAKNIKDQSRYYFTQGVIFHNNKMFEASINLFQKFLKIVLFIKDQKSIELALNSIGIAYIYLGNYQKAIQYHKKQREISENAQKFSSYINQGICKELQKQYEIALISYEKARRQAEKSSQISKFELANKFIQKLKQKAKIQTMDNIQGLYLTRTLQNTSRITYQKSFSKDQNESRLQQAIHSAQKNMSSFLGQLKKSYRHHKNSSVDLN